MTTKTVATPADSIICQLDGAKIHSVEIYLRKAHPTVTVEEYQLKFPEAPLLSPYAELLMAQRREQKAAEAAEAAAGPQEVAATQPNAGAAEVTQENKGIDLATLAPSVATSAAFHETFDLGSAKEALSQKGTPIPITVLGKHNPAKQEMVPQKSDSYVYNIDELKNAMLALEKNIPLYIWGHKGCGKSELVEQIAARTNRPFMRVQHSANTEESHVIGQWLIRGNETVFELGPLPLAMKNGWLFCADEYDFALPSVLAAYQAVLEGKPLIIKEADAANRVVKPHPDFRFVATGNTNGSGDETGLYQGTNLQNSANYDRFGMVINKVYLSKKDEAAILMKRLSLHATDANNLAEFAELVRESYDGGKISDTISPRTLIYAAMIGVARSNFHQGLECSFINKLTAVDRETCRGLAQRIFGS